MSDDLRHHAIDAVHSFRRMVEDFQSRNRAADAGLLVPESDATRAREFATRMDAMTAQLMRTFPEFSAADWEIFGDLAPNVKKIVMKTEGRI